MPKTKAKRPTREGRIFEHRVAEVYLMYAPREAHKVEIAIEQRRNGAEEAAILDRLLLKFGVTQAGHAGARFAAFYRKHAPLKLSARRVERLVAEGNWEKSIRALHHKYEVSYPPELLTNDSFASTVSSFCNTSGSADFSQGASPSQSFDSETADETARVTLPTAQVLPGARGMNRTGQLLAMHHRRAANVSAEDSATFAKNIEQQFRQRARISEDPFRDAAAACCGSALTVLASVDSTLTALVNGLDELVLDQGIQSKLLLCEAEVVSSQKSLNELRTTLESTSRPLIKKGAPLVDLLGHHNGAIDALEVRLSQAAQRVSIGIEELSAFKEQMQRHAQLGVIGCDDWSLKSLKSDDKKQNKDSADGSNKAESKPSHESGHQHFGGAAAVVQKTTELAKAARIDNVTGSVMGMLDSATRSIAHASSSTAAAVGLGSNAKSPVAVAAPEPTVPNFHFTEEERSSLETEHAHLVQQQRNENVEEARQVETSVRDLSKITSLMSEKLLEQGEQLMMASQNAEESKASLKKATEELIVAKQSRWNSTRTMIVLLWLATLSLLWFNRIIR